MSRLGDALRKLEQENPAVRKAAEALHEAKEHILFRADLARYREGLWQDAMEQADIDFHRENA